MRTKIVQAEGKSKRSLRLCRGAAYLSGSSSSAKCTSRGQKQTEFAVLPRRSIYGAVKVRFFFVSPRPAEDASAACGGTMQPSAWGGCGLPLSGRSRRANLLQSLVLAESECESVGNILNVYPKASRTSDWAFPARSGFTTFCHRKVAPKVSAGHLRRDRTEVLTERAQKTALFCTPAPGARTAVRSDSSSGAMRNLRCAARNDDYLLVSCFNRSPACRIALRK